MNLSHNSFGTIGHTEARPKPTADEVRKRRIASARSCSAWTAIDAGDLVERGRFLVSASTDDVFTAYRGAVWNALGGIAHSETNPLHWFVDETGDVRLLEKHGESWSEIVARQTRAEHRAKAQR